MFNNSTCPLWPNHPERCDTVGIVQKLCPSLSIVGCCGMIIIIWLFKKYKIFVQRIILALCISALFQSISFLMGSKSLQQNYFVCRAQAFGMLYFSWSTLSWVIVITLNMLFIIKGRKFNKLEIKYHCFVWLNSLLWASIPFIKDSYGPAGTWCWIEKDKPYFRFGVWYIPLFIICVWMLSTYTYILIHNRRLAKLTKGTLSMSFKNYNKEVKPLLLYPIIYAALTIPVFVYRLNDAFHPDEEPVYGLVLASVLSAPSVGSCMALVYAFHNESLHSVTWEKIKYSFATRFGSKPYNIRPYSVSSYRGSLRSRLSTKKKKKEDSLNGKLEYSNASFHSAKPDSTLVSREDSMEIITQET